LSSFLKYFTKNLTNCVLNYIITLSVPRLKHILTVIPDLLNPNKHIEPEQTFLVC